MATYQERFALELGHMLDETFEKVHGIYLDQGTSLSETLAPLTAEQASQPISARGTSIVAHVWHLTFYLDLVERGLRGEEIGKIDWEETWKTTTATPAEWEQMQQHLTQTYQNIRRTLAIPALQESPDAIADSMAVVVHTAYHIGAIRQILYVITA